MTTLEQTVAKTAVAYEAGSANGVKAKPVITDQQVAERAEASQRNKHDMPVTFGPREVLQQLTVKPGMRGLSDLQAEA